MTVARVGCAVIALGVRHSLLLLDMASTPPDTLDRRLGGSAALGWGSLVTSRCARFRL